MGQYPIMAGGRRNVAISTSECGNPLVRLCENCPSCNTGTKYCLLFLQELVRSDKWDYLNWERTKRTLKKLEWSNENVAQALLGVRLTNFQKVSPNCYVELLNGGSTIDADQYEIFFDGLYISLKIALFDDDGDWTGLVTFHTSGSGA